MRITALSLFSPLYRQDVSSKARLAVKAGRTKPSIYANQFTKRGFRLGTPTTHFIPASLRYRGSDPGTCNALHSVRELSAEYPVLVFYSTSHDPYHNLAIENYILRNSDHQSRILLFYVNRPCVVFGRNQNPWLECNIARIQEGLPWKSSDWDAGKDEQSVPKDGERVPLELIRRRSGGGTVIHDVGNLNFSFIVPNDRDFTRARHGEMVVSALKSTTFHESLGAFAKRLYQDVRINERNDIVMSKREPAPGEEKKEFKVTGSAYKLIRGRAMHHGTLLHSSPNVRGDSRQKASNHVFSTLLSSPGKAFIDAKGVSSVPSPVHNLFDLSNTLDVKSFAVRQDLLTRIVASIVEVFWNTYGLSSGKLAFEVGDADCLVSVNEAIAKDAHELMTDAWRFEQTPQFAFHSSSGSAIASEPGFSFKARHGAIDQAQWTGHGSEDIDRLTGTKLHQISDWDRILPTALPESRELVSKLKRIFPPITPSKVSLSSSPAGSEASHASKAVQRGNSVIRKRKDGISEVEPNGQNLVEEK